MRFNASLTTDDIPSLLDRFLAIIGPDPWLRRYYSLREQVSRNPLLSPFTLERHALELTLANLLELRHQSRQLPIDMTDPYHYRLFSFIAPVVLVYEQLTDAGKKRIAGILRGGLNADTGLAPFQSEIETVTQLMHRGFDVTFSDIDAGQRFDFLATRNDVEIEIEVKAASGDLGHKIHRRRMIDLSWHLQPVLQDAGGKIQGGYLVRVILPSRLYGRVEFLREVANSVELALRTDNPIPGPEPCAVELHPFDLSQSPFGSPDPSTVNPTSLRQFVARESGHPNPHLFVLFRPGRAAVVVLVESLLKDKVVGGLMRELKQAAKTQFTRRRPSILIVQFLDLTPADLLELAASDSADPRTASALQLASNLFFHSPERAHIHTLVYRSHGVLLQRVSIREDIVDHSYQEQGPTYSFRNPNHPLANDRRLSLFSS